jgi:hypothetical protein
LRDGEQVSSFGSGIAGDATPFSMVQDVSGKAAVPESMNAGRANYAVKHGLE